MTVPWEDAIDEAYQQPKQGDRGWTVKLHPVEVGCRGYVASSTSRLLWEIGVSEQAHRRAINIWLRQMKGASTGCGRKLKMPPGLPRHPANHKTHTQAWSACGGPTSAEGVLWWMGETPYGAEVHNWWCVFVVTSLPGNRLKKQLRCRNIQLCNA